MNFIEAVKAMEDGKKVKKTIWDHQDFQMAVIVILKLLKT